MSKVPGPSPASTLDDSCNAFALRRASRHLTAAYNRHLAAAGLRTTQFTVLQKLHSHPDLPIGELAQIIGMDRTTMTKNLQPLTREGWVTVGPSSTDRRTRIVTITQAGRDRFDLALPLWRDAQEQFEDEFGATRAAELRRLARAAATTADSRDEI